MMRDNTQIMLFIAYLLWDCGILTGMDTGTQAMISFFFHFPIPSWLFKQLAQHGSFTCFSPFLFGIISEVPLKMPK